MLTIEQIEKMIKSQLDHLTVLKDDMKQSQEMIKNLKILKLITETNATFPPTENEIIDALSRNLKGDDKLIETDINDNELIPSPPKLTRTKSIRQTKLNKSK
jgi:hypothetical protein